MRKTPIVDKFLIGYRKAAINDADKALAIMLELNAEEIEPLFESKDPLWMHKAFRQTDVTDSASKDMVIWHLIHAAPMFWDELQSFWGMLERRDRKNKIRALEEERDELLSALESLAECYCEAGNELSRSERLHHHAVYRDVLNAIAKAKGSTENHSPDAGKMVLDGCNVEPMTLDEAITHANEKSMGDSQCAAQHAQLAKWLTDYRAMLAAAQKPEGGAA